MSVTKAQRVALEYARDDVVLEVGGLNGRPVRLDVLRRLRWLQFIQYDAGQSDPQFGRTAWRLTDAGRNELESKPVK